MRNQPVLLIFVRFVHGFLFCTERESGRVVILRWSLCGRGRRKEIVRYGPKARFRYIYIYIFPRTLMVGEEWLLYNELNVLYGCM